jgi:hypothetical protein
MAGARRLEQSGDEAGTRNYQEKDAQTTAKVRVFIAWAHRRRSKSPPSCPGTPYPESSAVGIASRQLPSMKDLVQSFTGVRIAVRRSLASRRNVGVVAVFHPKAGRFGFSATLWASFTFPDIPLLVAAILVACCISTHGTISFLIEIDFTQLGTAPLRSSAVTMFENGNLLAARSD